MNREAVERVIAEMTKYERNTERAHPVTIREWRDTLQAALKEPTGEPVATVVHAETPKGHVRMEVAWTGRDYPPGTKLYLHPATLATPEPEGELAGEPVAWQYRIQHAGSNEKSRWTDWPQEERPETIGRWNVEYRSLYLHPAPSAPTPEQREAANVRGVTLEMAEMVATMYEAVGPRAKARTIRKTIAEVKDAALQAGEG